MGYVTSKCQETNRKKNNAKEKRSSQSEKVQKEMELSLILRCFIAQWLRTQKIADLQALDRLLFGTCDTKSCGKVYTSRLTSFSGLCTKLT